ncbi:unnamed protein product [Lampetra fluviatilis]
MALNLDKNRTALLAAYEDVCSEKSSTSWALFSYEGNTNDLKLVMCGANGLEEMVEELNSGKVMYAFCKVKDSKAGLCKYVLINWIGEGVSDGRKGTCANHVNSVGNFFKGAHVTINARAEEDVEPEVIMEKVGKAAGVSFGLQQENSCFVDNAPRKPVGSVYQKTNAAVEIKRVKNDGFWARAEREEKLRKEEERLRAEEQRKREEEERQERERQEAGERERRFLEKAREIDELKKYQEKADSEDRSKEKQKWEQEENDYQQRMRRGYKKSESVEKAAEAATVIQQRSLNPREIFKQKERAMSYDHTTPTPYSPGQCRGPFNHAGEIRATPESIHECFSASLLSAKERRAKRLIRSTAGAPNALGLYTDPSGYYYSQYQEQPTYQQDGYQQESADGYPTEQYDLEGKGQCARALYDYQAADETEITFDPDDLITHIDQIDEGWWRGYGPDGRYGLFPANYVQLLN